MKDLFVWESFNRPTNIYSKRGLIIISSGVAVFTLFLILFQEWLATLVSWAALFLFVILDRIPAEKVHHKITTEGIVSMNHSYIWEDLGPFWFTTKGKNRILHLARRNLFGHLVILLDPKDEEKIREELIKYLPYVEVPEKSNNDKVLEWINKS